MGPARERCLCPGGAGLLFPGRRARRGFEWPWQALEASALIANVNRAITCVFARHLLQFVVVGTGSTTFQLPAVVMAQPHPTWGAATYSNTVGAAASCIVVYDLFHFGVQCFITRQLGNTDAAGKRAGIGCRSHPLNFALSIYCHLAAVLVVSLSPLGCHAQAVVAFMTISAVVDAMQSRGTAVPLPFFSTGASGYGKILTLWDAACNTSNQ